MEIIKKSHGGARVGAGRKPKFGEKTALMRVPESAQPVVVDFLAELAQKRQADPKWPSHLTPVKLAENPTSFKVPLFNHTIQAGFPSPADEYVFGVLSSTMHMAWVRVTAGRLESRYRYSAKYTYNTFPWPTGGAEQIEAIKKAAKGVLDSRANHPGSTLADLYDPLTMPVDLSAAHKKLDRAVDLAYGRKLFSSESERVGFLFAEYQRQESLLPAAKKPRK